MHAWNITIVEDGHVNMDKYATNSGRYKVKGMTDADKQNEPTRSL